MIQKMLANFQVRGVVVLIMLKIKSNNLYLCNTWGRMTNVMALRMQRVNRFAKTLLKYVLIRGVGTIVKSVLIRMATVLGKIVQPLRKVIYVAQRIRFFTEMNLGVILVIH